MNSFWLARKTDFDSSVTEIIKYEFLLKILKLSYADSVRIILPKLVLLYIYYYMDQDYIIILALRLSFILLRFLIALYLYIIIFVFEIITIYCVKWCGSRS